MVIYKETRPSIDLIIPLIVCSNTNYSGTHLCRDDAWMYWLCMGVPKGNAACDNEAQNHKMFHSNYLPMI
jgi:hypothetical protein